MDCISSAQNIDWLLSVVHAEIWDGWGGNLWEFAENLWEFVGNLWEFAGNLWEFAGNLWEFADFVSAQRHLVVSRCLLTGVIALCSQDDAGRPDEQACEQ